MKPGDRVCVKLRMRPRKWQPLLGTVIRVGDGQVMVKWDIGACLSHDAEALTKVERFPYRSHRTMAQVIADEQKPEPA